MENFCLALSHKFALEKYDMNSNEHDTETAV